MNKHLVNFDYLPFFFSIVIGNRFKFGIEAPILRLNLNNVELFGWKFKA
jgi:hypothetical protein